MVTRPVVALFVDPRGPYPDRTDSWDATRDARAYDRSDAAIVAHPPCGPWSSVRHLSRADDATHGPFAVELVRRFGGVLEHPAGSKLWGACLMPRPGELPDTCGGFSLAVDQCNWGHVARKSTWLYIVGLEGGLPALPPKREPTHWCSGSRGATRADGSPRSGSPVPPGIKVCSAAQRRRTPPAFADWLLELASRCKEGANHGTSAAT